MPLVTSGGGTGTGCSAAPFARSSPVGTARLPPRTRLSLSYKIHSPRWPRVVPMSNNVNPIPEGYHSVNCFLAVPDGNKAIEFYSAVFGAKVLSRNDLPDGQPAHAELAIGDSTIQMGMPIPEHGVRAPESDWVHTSIVHYCLDADAV